MGSEFLTYVILRVAMFQVILSTVMLAGVFTGLGFGLAMVLRRKGS